MTPTELQALVAIQSLVAFANAQGESTGRHSLVPCVYALALRPSCIFSPLVTKGDNPMSTCRPASADFFSGIPRWLRIGILALALPVMAGCWQKDIGRSYYPSGKLKTEATVRNGLLDGAATMYSENGMRMNEANYKAGMLHGKSTAYYESGNKKAEAEYKDGVLDGVSIEWSADEKVLNRVEFSKGLLQNYPTK